MCRSLTATATTVASQRFLASPAWPEGEPEFKQLGLHLDPTSSPHSPQRRGWLLSQSTTMAHKKYKAPITQLPVELLSYIFVLSAHTPDPRASEEDTQQEPEEGSDDISPCLSSSVSTTPDVLASVNRHWRGVALNTPQLWTRICVTIGDIMYCREGPMFSVVSRYLSRSGKSPLDVFVDARDPEWDFSETE